MSYNINSGAWMQMPEFDCVYLLQQTLSSEGQTNLLVGFTVAFNPLQHKA